MEIIQVDNSEDRILDSLLLIPQDNELEYESEIDFLNEQTCFWMWGQLPTADYLDIVASTVTNGVDVFLEEFDQVLRRL